MADARERLKLAVRGIWNTPEMQAIAASESQALKGGYGDCLKKLMDSGSAGSDAYKECAKVNNVGQTLAGLWPGKR